MIKGFGRSLIKTLASSFTRRGINRISLRSIRLRTPRSDYVIVDRYKSSQCIDLLKKKGIRSWAICDIRGERVYLDCLFSVFLKKLIRIDCRGEYIRSFLCLAKAKYVYSYVDDSASIYIVANKMKKTSFHIFQNGFRDQWELISMKKFMKEEDMESLNNVTYYSWGTNNKEQFESVLGIKDINIEVYGSLSSRLAEKSSEVNRKRGIVFISQYRRCGNPFDWEGEKVSHGEFYYPELYLVPVLSRFCDTNDTTFNILTSNSWQGDISKEEVDFYTRLGVRKDSIVSSDNPYLFTDSFELVVSIDSSLGFEAASRGSKVLFSELRFTNRARLRRNRSLYPLKEKIEGSDACKFVCFENSEFEKKLLECFDMKLETYGRIWKSFFRDFLIKDYYSL